MDEKIKNYALTKIQQVAQGIKDFAQPSTYSFRKAGYENVPIAASTGYQQAQAQGSFNSPPSQFNFQQAGEMIGSAAGAIKGMFSAPPAPQDPKMWRQPTNEVIRQSDVPNATPYPSTTPIPTPQAMGTADPNFRFAYEQFPQDTEAPGRKNFKPSQPPPQIANVIRKIFPNEATAAALVASTENAQFDPRRADNINASGSRDRGIFQINEDTFNGLKQRQGGKLKKLGIHSFEDMYDPEKNALVAKLIKEGAKAYRPETNPEGWGGWFGWQDTGYDLNKGYYTKKDRIEHAEKKKRLKAKKK